MVKISELKAAEEVHAKDMRDAEYRREYERTRLANDVAIRVIQYRVRHGLSQTELAKRLGMRQPNVARLESGEHEPTIATLSLLAEVLNQDFSIEVKPSRMGLRRRAPGTGARASDREASRDGNRILAPAASGTLAPASRPPVARAKRSSQRPAECA
jgi:transcriptional regulator with XRE-family HTH domain